MPIQPVYFPVLGFIAISLSSWSFILQKILEFKTSSKKVLVKSLKLMLFLFVITAAALYLPYILTSNWFGSILTSLIIKAPQLTKFIEKLSFSLIYFWSLNEEWKYFFSQFLGASTLTLASLIEGVLLSRGGKRKVRKEKGEKR
ncbi:hypothetical protein KEJ50_04195 [Candidatus Bathyarchaeota archaeon]|nr:hypothetical protein [Candidatus Bathyarchaeota archaeon]